ncbi:MAG: hypothetical protein J7K23_00170 [Thermoproteales archaeon]|nr:hypothetical protein [Thermoproteales archaeon]
MTDAFNIAISLPNNKIAKGKIYRSWTPFNYEKITNSLPLKTRVYYIGRDLIYLPFNIKFKPEKYIEKISKGQILIIHYLNSLSISLAPQRIYRYKATLVGEITEGLENLKFLKKGDIVTIKGE